jgi:hypothetical protein
MTDEAKEELLARLEDAYQKTSRHYQITGADYEEGKMDGIEVAIDIVKEAQR